MSADRVAEAIRKVAPPDPSETFIFRVAMGEGRTAVLSLPMNTSDSELIQLIGIIAGPGGVELAGQQAKAATGLVKVDRGMLRPV